MSNNKSLKIMVTAIAVVALIAVIVISAGKSGFDASQTHEVYIETIETDGTINRVQVADEDADLLIDVLSEDATREGSFVFAEGGYRIVMAQVNKEWHLYPYCGDLTTIRTGDSGNKYIAFDEGSDEIKIMDSVIGKYIDTENYQGDYDWKKAIIEGIEE